VRALTWTHKRQIYGKDAEADGVKVQMESRKTQNLRLGVGGSRGGGGGGAASLRLAGYMYMYQSEDFHRCPVSGQKDMISILGQSSKAPWQAAASRTKLVKFGTLQQARSVPVEQPRKKQHRYRDFATLGEPWASRDLN
jgi:hypothetical protein